MIIYTKNGQFLIFRTFAISKRSKVKKNQTIKQKLHTHTRSKNISSKFQTKWILYAFSIKNLHLTMKTVILTNNQLKKADFQWPMIEKSKNVPTPSGNIRNNVKQSNKQVKWKKKHTRTHTHIQLVWTKRIHWILNEVHGYNKIYPIHFAFLRSSNYDTIIWMNVRWVCRCLRHKYTRIHLYTFFSSFCFGWCCCYFCYCCCCCCCYFCCYSCWATIESLVNQPWLYNICYVCIIHTHHARREIKKKQSHVHMISIEFYVGFSSVPFWWHSSRTCSHIFVILSSDQSARMCVCVGVCVCVFWPNGLISTV